MALGQLRISARCGGSIIGPTLMPGRAYLIDIVLNQASLEIYNNGERKRESGQGRESWLALCMIACITQRRKKEKKGKGTRTRITLWIDRCRYSSSTRSIIIIIIIIIKFMYLMVVFHRRHFASRDRQPRLSLHSGV